MKLSLTFAVGLVLMQLSKLPDSPVTYTSVESNCADPSQQPPNPSRRVPAYHAYFLLCSEENGSGGGISSLPELPTSGVSKQKKNP